MSARTSRATAAALTLPLAAALAACGGGQGERTGSTAVSTTSSASPSASTATPSTTRTTTAVSSTTSATVRPTAAKTATASTRPRATTSRPPQAPSPKPSGQGSALGPVPASPSEPAVRFPKNQPAVGSGANAQVGPIPDSVWGRMVGYSWTEGCPVGRSGLRYVTVNFWGFDGKRSRGALVVHSSVAGKTASAFTALYEQRFRIRQMKVMDSGWGKNPKGPGANDYAAMNADNTSAFNCRYVGGQEEKRQYSNHAYGKAIDVNDWENPYVADDGRVYPNTYYVRHRGSAPGVFTSSSSPATRAFTRQGMEWGGLWANPDYQHFDAS